MSASPITFTASVPFPYALASLSEDDYLEIEENAALLIHTEKARRTAFRFSRFSPEEINFYNFCRIEEATVSQDRLLQLILSHRGSEDPIIVASQLSLDRRASYIGAERRDYSGPTKKAGPAGPTEPPLLDEVLATNGRIVAKQLERREKQWDEVYRKLDVTHPGSPPWPEVHERLKSIYSRELPPDNLLKAIAAAPRTYWPKPAVRKPTLKECGCQFKNASAARDRCFHSAPNGNIGRHGAVDPNEFVHFDEHAFRKGSILAETLAATVRMGGSRNPILQYCYAGVRDTACAIELREAALNLSQRCEAALNLFQDYIANEEFYRKLPVEAVPERTFTDEYGVTFVIVNARNPAWAEGRATLDALVSSWELSPKIAIDDPKYWEDRLTRQFDVYGFQKDYVSLAEEFQSWVDEAEVLRSGPCLSCPVDPVCFDHHDWYDSLVANYATARKPTGPGLPPTFEFRSCTINKPRKHKAEIVDVKIHRGDSDAIGPLIGIHRFGKTYEAPDGFAREYESYDAEFEHNDPPEAWNTDTVRVKPRERTVEQQVEDPRLRRHSQMIDLEYHIDFGGRSKEDLMNDPDFKKAARFRAFERGELSQENIAELEKTTVDTIQKEIDSERKRLQKYTIDMSPNARPKVPDSIVRRMQLEGGLWVQVLGTNGQRPQYRRIYDWEGSERPDIRGLIRALSEIRWRKAVPGRVRFLDAG